MGRLALAVALLALAACSGPDAGASSQAFPATASGRVTVPTAEVASPRTLQAARLVEVRVLTAHDADALVTSARLDSPLFADSPARAGEVRLFPDWTNRVRVPLGTPVCPAPEGPSTVVLTMTVDGRQVTETLQAEDSVLRQLNDEECREQAVLDVATPSFGPITAQDASQLETTIVLTRGDARTDEPVALESMTGNIVFIVRLDTGTNATLAAGTASIAVPATILVGRCDPHVFAESKKTFVFPVRLGVGHDAPGYVEIQPDAATKAALQKLFDDCGDADREGSG